MNFNNPDNIILFDRFISIYRITIDQIRPESKNMEILIFSNSTQNYGWLLSDNDYFIYCYALKSKNIGYNEDKCDSVYLSDMERYAFIAHELGHIFNPDEQNIDNNLSNENGADLFSVEIGLKDYMISGLRKIVTDTALNEIQKDCITERINRLTNNT